MPSRHVKKKNGGREGGGEEEEKRKKEEIRITIPFLSPRATVSILRPAPVHGAPKGTRRVKPCTLHLTDAPPTHPPMRKCQSSKRSEGGRRDPPRQHTRHRPGQGCHLSGFARGFPPAVPRETTALPAHHPLLADRLKCALLAAACLRKWNRSSASCCRCSSRRCLRLH